MANNNYRIILNAISELGLTDVQVFYGKNPKQITNIIVNGNKYSTSAISSKAMAITKLKQWTCPAEENTQAHNVLISKNNTVTISGNKYDMLELIKDMEYHAIISYLKDMLSQGKDWQRELAQRIMDWFRTDGLVEWMIYNHEKETGISFDEELAQDHELTAV